MQHELFKIYLFFCIVPVDRGKSIQPESRFQAKSEEFASGFGHNLSQNPRTEVCNRLGIEENCARKLSGF